MNLVDTSVWIAFFRRRDPIDLEALVPLDEVATCLPVLQEVLQGIGDERSFRRAATSLRAMPIVESPLRESVFLEAVDLYRRARRAGWTVRSGVDCVIAACALRHDLEVLHDDRDYPALAKVSGLRERSLVR
jgi:predicted nucleic acid-binding protein